MTQKPSSSQDNFRERQDLTGEHKVGDAGQTILAVLFFAVYILDGFVFKWTTFLNSQISAWLRIPVGFLLLILAGYLARSGIKIVFGEVRQKPGVIREGVFKWMRHPIYLGEILLYAGLLCLNLSLAAGVVWIMIIIFLNAISRYEERLLLDRFGEDYRRYMQEVGMWLPRVGKN